MTTNQTTQSQHKAIWFIRIATAVTFGLTGFYIIYALCRALLVPSSTISWTSLFFLVFFAILALCAAIYFLYCSINLLRHELTSKVMTQCAFALSMLLFILLLSSSYKMTKHLFEQNNDLLISSLSSLITVFLLTSAGVFYLAAKRCLLKWFSLQEIIDIKRHQRATKLYFGFLAFFVFSAMTSIVITALPDESWIAMVLWIAAISIAWGFYRMGLKLFLKSPNLEPIEPV